MPVAWLVFFLTAFAEETLDVGEFSSAEDSCLVDRLHHPKLDPQVAEALNKADTVSIIVTITHATPMVSLEPRRSGDRTILRPTKIGIDAEDAEKGRSAYDAAASFFNSRKWSSKPVFIETASAVSVEVTEDELCSILDQEFIDRVSFNRTHSR